MATYQTPTLYRFEGEEVEAIQFCPWDQMFLIEGDNWTQPEWVEVDDDRFEIIVGHLTTD